MIRVGLAPGKTMKITGYNRFETFSLCENIDDYTARRAAPLLDEHSKKEKPSDLGESEGEFIVNLCK
jgi:hypothetical protein